MSLNLRPIDEDHAKEVMAAAKTRTEPVDFPISGSVFGLGLIVLVVYANSFGAQFTLDNKMIILGDSRLQAWTMENLKRIFTQDYWWPNFPSDLYRPFTTLSYLINYTVFGGGDRPAGYHWVNLLLHWSNALLVLGLARHLGCGPVRSRIAAVLFAVHPVAVESVTNVVGRADLLVAFFSLAGLYCHVSIEEATGQREKWFWRVAVGLSAMAAIGCKENGIVLVAVIVLYELIYQCPDRTGLGFREKTGRRLLRAVAPLGPALILFGMVRARAGDAAVVPWQYFVDNPIAGAGPIQGLLTAVRVQGLYLQMVFWPARLSCDYSYNQIPLYGTGSSGELEMAWLSLAAIGLLLGMAWRLRARYPDVTFAMGLYFLAMAPMANVAVRIGSIMAERFLYLSLVGFAIACSWILERLWILPRFTESAWVRRLGSRILLALMLVGLALRSHARNRDWRDELSLWRSAVAASPESFKVYRGLAGAWFEHDPTEAGVDRAIAEAEKGLAILNRPEIDTHVERRDSTLFIDLGRFYRVKADWCAKRGAQADSLEFRGKAIALLQRACATEWWVNQESRRIRLNGGAKPEEIHTIGRSDLHEELAVALFDAGRFEEAIASAEVGARLLPDRPDPWHFIGSCLIRLNRPEDAAVCEFTALLINFHYTPAWRDLYGIYAQTVPQANPIRLVAPDKYTLALETAPARRNMATACIEYDRFLRRENFPLLADRLEAYAVSTFGINPGEFPVRL